ncbi:hypothetical protein [Actinopolymorpha pittospori]|uniref:Uncharacterized protein n=1 Tax=Actinopolymorpha pittospori TaxID=648752 RepID=A0A927MUF6_9ACTN|nr:hypothetical protein [Actinopolymorpha pittospori]MBE1603507.1 hypothetical protein [Actinopolymorpha pittospori]
MQFADGAASETAAAVRFLSQLRVVSSMNDGHIVDGFGSHTPAVHATTG